MADRLDATGTRRNTGLSKVVAFAGFDRHHWIRSDREEEVDEEWILNTIPSVEGRTGEHLGLLWILELIGSRL